MTNIQARGEGLEDPNSTSVLYQYHRVGSLASGDPNCLIGQALLRFSGYQFKEDSCDNPHLSPRGNLPFLRKGEEIVDGLEDIFKFLQKGTEFCSSLSGKDMNDCAAYTALLTDYVYPAILYQFWMIPENYSTLTKELYSSAYHWPVNHIMMSNFYSKMSAELRLKFNKNSEEVINENSGRAFAALSEKLGGNHYMLGDQISHLDAYMFGYLYTILTLFPNTELCQSVKEHRNLVALCENIAHEYFKDT
eukprot:Nk52_evm27s1444 gene=Nk52_evmTU27s1444